MEKIPPFRTPFALQTIRSDSLFVRFVVIVGSIVRRLSRMALT